MRRASAFAVVLAVAVLLWAACAEMQFELPHADAGVDRLVTDVTTSDANDAAVVDVADSSAAVDFEDFHVPGSQIGDLLPSVFLRPSDCAPCHGAKSTPLAPYPTWSTSLMSVAGRDPLFFAQLATANQDVPGVGYYCLRCHVPLSIVTGHAADPSGGSLDERDKDGVSCHFCHALVDPTANDGGDSKILGSLADKPSSFGNAQFVVDPSGLRRGPYQDAAAMHPFASSSFVRRGELCGTCHDVGNPAVARVDGGYAYDAPKQRASDPDPTAQFPLERTFSEWRASAFAKVGVDMGGRFGGPGGGIVSTCEDCHMPREPGQGCLFAGSREDLARHDFAGASAWVLDIISLREGSKVDQLALAAGHANAVSMLRRAAELTVTKAGSSLVVRVENESGHKLPTGHIEGRRVFLDVVFADVNDSTLVEHGAWDQQTGLLGGAPTAVFEMTIGLSPGAAKVTGLPAGPTTHMSLADTVVSDNRIPPRGFNNVAYAAVGAGPVGATYADGQNWADVPFAIPPNATHVKVRLLYQTVTAEYIEALANGNKTNSSGAELKSLWIQTSRAPPIEMDSVELDLP